MSTFFVIDINFLITLFPIFWQLAIIKIWYIISFDYSWFLEKKTSLVLYPCLENSTTGIAMLKKLGFSVIFCAAYLTKAELLLLKLIHLLARELFLMKKLEIEKTKPTLIISVLKVEYTVILVSWISNFFIDKMFLANDEKKTTFFL